MEHATALIAAVAALLGAVAWPIVMVLAYRAFRRPLHEIAGRLPTVVGRVSKLKAMGIEAELSAASDAVADRPPEDTAPVSGAQIAAAVRVAADAEQVPIGVIRAKVDDLSRQYQIIRQTMPPGPQRTREMTRIMAQMRAASLAAKPFLRDLTRSTVPGDRLMAIAILQISPEIESLSWLVERFGSEQPFVFFHAAVALQSIVQSVEDEEELLALAAGVASARNIVARFPDKPDVGTIQLLQAIEHQARDRIGSG